MGGRGFRNSALGMDVEIGGQWRSYLEKMEGGGGPGCLSIHLPGGRGQDPCNEEGFRCSRGSCLFGARPERGRASQPSAGTMRSWARASRVHSSGKTRSPRGPGAWKAKSKSRERPS